MERLIRLAEFLGHDKQAEELCQWQDLQSGWWSCRNGSFMCAIVAACDRSAPLKDERDTLCLLVRDIYQLSNPVWFPFTYDSRSQEKQGHSLLALRCMVGVFTFPAYKNWNEDFDEGLVPALTSVCTHVGLALFGTLNDATRERWETLDREIADIVRRYFPDPVNMLAVVKDLP